MSSKFISKGYYYTVVTSVVVTIFFLFVVILYIFEKNKALKRLVASQASSYTEITKIGKLYRCVEITDTDTIVLWSRMQGEHERLLKGLEIKSATDNKEISALIAEIQLESFIAGRDIGSLDSMCSTIDLLPCEWWEFISKRPAVRSFSKEDVSEIEQGYFGYPEGWHNERE